MSYCPQCGAETPEGAAFCGVCGTPITAPRYDATLDQESNPYAVGAQAAPASSPCQGGELKPTFGETLKRCLGKKYADFSGRASRREYWYYGLWMLLLIIPLIMVAGVLGGIVGASGGPVLTGLVVGGIMLVWALYIFVPGCAVLTRRFHDVGLPTWLAVTTFIVLNVLNWGRNFLEDASASLVCSSIGLVLSVFILIVACVGGKPEPNKYGLPPADRKYRSY